MFIRGISDDFAKPTKTILRNPHYSSKSLYSLQYKNEKLPAVDKDMSKLSFMVTHQWVSLQKKKWKIRDIVPNSETPSPSLS